MLKFSFRRERDKEFKHIAHGLIPAASIAPKPAVPRTPPPRSPNPSPERPRSALAAAILSSSLTGQTWAIPPARPRSLSESVQSESSTFEPNISTRDRWSEDLVSRPRLSSPDQSEGELEDKEEEVENEEDGEEHVYQTLDRRQNSSLTESVYALPLRAKKMKLRVRKLLQAQQDLISKKKSAREQCPTPQPSQRCHRRAPSPAGRHIVEPNERTSGVSAQNRFQSILAHTTAGGDHRCEAQVVTDFTEETSGPSPEPNEKKMSVRKSPEHWKDDLPCRSTPVILTADPPRKASQAKGPKPLSELPPGPSSIYSEVRKKAVRGRQEKNTRMADKEKLLEERLQCLEWEIRDRKGFSNQRCSAGSQAELQNLRQHAQELVDENDALKLTVHRLNVELSHYQARFRPLSREEHSKVGGLPNTGSPPPWLVDMKYLSPLLLAYEDRLNEKDALLQTTEEDMKKLRVQLEDAIKENEKLHDEIAKAGAVGQKDCHQLQQQAFLVLQENQVLIDQLEAQHAEAKATHSKHNSEVTKVSKQLMLLEVKNQRLQEDLEESRTEMQKNMKELQVLQARLKDAVTWDEHCSIAGKLRRQLEQQERINQSEMDKLLLRVSNLQEENRVLALDKAHLTAKIMATEAELELSRQASRRAERRMSVLKRQKEECVLKEEKTRHYLGAVISVAEHISQERDRLLDMASSLQQEKQRFISRILSGTVRFGKLQEEVKVYRSQASTRLAALEEAVEGRTASYQREILHLQRLLRERQEAEEKLLQSKREIEEELEGVWQAATRENQQMRESLWDSELTGNLRSPPAQPPDEITTSSQHQHKHGLDFYC